MINELLPLSARKMEVLFEIYSSKHTYLREIARTLEIEPSLCLKILKSILKSKMLGLEKSGKQIYYTIAPSYESWLLAMLLDEFYVEKMALNSKKLSALVSLVRANASLTEACSRIYVFGSYARGTFKKGSDMDMLFVTGDKKTASSFMWEASSALDLEVSGIAVSEKEFAQGIKNKDSIIWPIADKPKERLVVWMRSAGETE